MMMRKTELMGMIWGAFTGLGVLALSYMWSDITHTHFLPLAFFGLPEGSQPAITTIIRSAAIYLLIGAFLGIFVAEFQVHSKGFPLLASIIGAGILFLSIVLFTLVSGVQYLLSPGFLIWQAVLLIFWSWVLTRLIAELDRPISNSHSPQNQSRRMTSRQFRYLVIAGILTAIVSALQILWIRSGN